MTRKNIIPDSWDSLIDSQTLWARRWNAFFYLMFFGITSTAFAELYLQLDIWSFHSEFEFVLMCCLPASMYGIRVVHLRTTRLGEFFRDNTSLSPQQWYEQHQRSEATEKLSWANLFRTVEGHRLGNVEQRRSKRLGFPENSPAHTLGYYLAVTTLVSLGGLLALRFVFSLARLTAKAELFTDLTPNILLSNDVLHYGMVSIGVIATLTYLLLRLTVRDPEVLNTKITT